MTKLRIVPILLLALILSSCGGAPKEVIDSAIATFDNDIDCHPNEDWYRGGECRDFKVSFAERKTLTGAHKANGIDAAWCLQIDYIWKSDAGGEWKQNSRGFYVTQLGDEYIAQPLSFWSDMDDCLSR